MRTWIRVAAVLLLWLFPCAALADSVTISDQGAPHAGYCHDAALNADAANVDNNYGGSTTINFGGDLSGDHLLGVYRFDTSQVPVNADVTAVTMGVEVTFVIGGGETLTIYQMAPANKGWAEGSANGAVLAGSISWNDHTNANQREHAGGAGCDLAGTDYINTSLGTIDCTTTGTKTGILNAAGIQAVEDSIPEGDFEVVIIPSSYAAGTWATLASSENATTAYRPYLQVTYAEGAAVTTVNISERVGDTAGFEDGRIAGGGNADLNSGATTVFTTGRFTDSGGERRVKSLIRCNLASIPNGSTIDQAYFTFYVSTINGGGQGLYIYQIADGNNNWAEGDNDNATADAGESCWASFAYPGFTWIGSAGLETAGTDYINTILGSRSILTTGEKIIYLNSTTRAAIRSRLGADDIEFLLAPYGYPTANINMNFDSSENGTDGNRARLTIKYTAPDATSGIITAEEW